MIRTIAARTGSLGVARNAAPRLAGALLVLAGAVLAILLPVAAVQSAVPLGPFLMWLNWMALFGAVAVAVVAVLRVRRLEAQLRHERQRFRALGGVECGTGCQGV